MAIKQLTVFVENKRGAVIPVTETLSKHNINLRALSIAETQDFGILRLIVSDPETARDLLASLGCVASITQVVAVAVSDRPGALTDVMRVLSEKEINVEYMYAFLTSKGHSAYVVLRVGDNDAATALLSEAGIELVSESDIREL